MATKRPQRQFKRWLDDLAQHLPHLSKAQAHTLALWTFAATLTEHLGSTTCAAFLAETFEGRENTFRQRLREFYRPAERKRGTHRCQLDARLSFAPLLAWVLKLLRPPELVLALDPTLVRDRFAVLAVSVVAHGCAIAVAWVVVGANTPGQWMPHWKPLLAHLHAAVPEPMRVIVLTDRGLKSRTLFKDITSLGWHPMMRLTRVGAWRERGATAAQPLGERSRGCSAQASTTWPEASSSRRSGTDARSLQCGARASTSRGF